MSKQLRDFVRLDAKGIPVIGSNIRRFKKPVSGRWSEFYKPNCCEDEIVTDGFAFDDAATAASLIIQCGGDTQITAVINDLTAVDGTLSLQQFADFLNNNFGYLGFFGVSSEELTLRVNKFIGSNCDDALSFEIDITA